MTLTKSTEGQIFGPVSVVKPSMSPELVSLNNVDYAIESTFLARYGNRENLVMTNCRANRCERFGIRFDLVLLGIVGDLLIVFAVATRELPVDIYT